MRLSVGLTALLLILFSGQAYANPAAELKAAEKALKAGEYDAAFREYSRIAEDNDNPLAHFSLALFFDLGWGRPADPSKACQSYEKAAAGGVPVAQHSLGKCYEQGIHKPADPVQAARWYDTAVGMGHLLSLCDLARLHMTGAGVPKDPNKGLEMCAQAAERNSPAAQVMLGKFLLDGDESIRDHVAALSWFDQAAQQNSPAAQYYLGMMLRDGLGTVPNEAAARQMFESAAAQGYRDAYFPTAKSYFDAFAGSGSEAELAKAYLWLAATLKRSPDPAETDAATKMLDKVRDVMPPGWIADLDAKVADHLAAYPQIQ